jgi:hypothetical protein
MIKEKVEVIGTSVQDLLTEIVSKYNNKHLRSINETNVKRFLERHTSNGYVIISACRGSEYFNLDKTIPQQLNKLNQLNNQRTKDLLNDIKEKGFTYTPCFGGFIENKGLENEQEVYEKSFIIYPYKRDKSYNFQELKDFAIEMCDKYDQDSVLIKAPTEKPKCYDDNGDITMEMGNDATFNDITQEYFTDLNKNTTNKIKPNSKPTRFTFTETYIPLSPQTYSEGVVRYYKGEQF